MVPPGAWVVALPHLGLLDDVRHVFSLDADGCFESFAALFCPLCTRTAIETSIIQGVTGHCFATLATGRFSVGNRQRVESWGLPDAGILSRQFRESGKPLEGWFLAPFRLIPSFDGRIAAGKMAGMACWIGSLLAMHACLRRLARLDGPVALTISGIAVAAPVYEVLGDVSLAMYPACMLLFWCGWLLFAAALNCRGSVAIACRVAAVALLFLSFNVNSLLVMRYAVAATFAVLRLRDVPWGDMRARLVPAALRYPEILALPVVFWIWKAVFTPTSGFYAALQQALLRPAETGPGGTRASCSTCSPPWPATWSLRRSGC